MSVISAVDLLVERTIFSNTNGTPPAAGVDLEPDLVVEQLTNVSFVDCIARDNFGMGFQMFLRAWPNASVAPFSVTLDNYSIVGGNSQGFAVGGVREGVAGTLSVRNSKCSGTVKSAVFVWDKSATASHVSFANCTFEESCGGADVGCAPFEIASSCDGAPKSKWAAFDVGGLSFSDSTLIDGNAVARPFFRASAGKGQHIEGVAARGLSTPAVDFCTYIF
jgi:hypothetical protein